MPPPSPPPPFPRNNFALWGRCPILMACCTLHAHGKSGLPSGHIALHQWSPSAGPTYPSHPYRAVCVHSSCSTGSFHRWASLSSIQPHTWSMSSNNAISQCILLCISVFLFLQCIMMMHFNYDQTLQANLYQKFLFFIFFFQFLNHLKYVFDWQSLRLWSCFQS